jgi:HK97 family phage major capsid protein
MDQPYKQDFETLGDFLVAAANARYGKPDHRLQYAAAAGLEGSVGTSGGFLVPSEHAGELHDRIYSTGSIISRCTTWPVTGENFIIPMVDEKSRANGSRHGGVKMNWTLPGDEIIASKPKFASREISRKSLKGLVYVTNELFKDVPQLESIFTRLFSLEGAFEIENSIVNGSGAGKPLGILNADCTISVAKESGQAAATIEAANVVNMFARLWSPSKSRAVWLVNQDVSPQLYGLVWATGTGVVPLFRWSPDGTPLLMGRPVLEVEYCSTLGTVGDIVLADLGEYLIGDPEQIAVQISEHVKFTNDESAFRFAMRVDGHPSWSAATTPLNGTATVSPFVVLATRA